MNNILPKISNNKNKTKKKYKSLVKNRLIAMVPVRAGSTRVQNKNIRPFGDTNLLQLKLKLLKKLTGLQI